MHKLVLLVMASLGATATVHAAKLDYSKVSAQANWVAHADFDALRKSTVGAFIIAKAKEDPETAKGIASLKAIFGIDLDALSSFTAYGRGEPKKGILSLKGGFDAVRLQAMVELNESYSAQKHGDAVIHFIDKHTGDPKAVSFPAKDEIIGSPTTGYTKHGLDVVNGKAPSLEPKGIHEAISGTLPHPILTIAVNVKGVAEVNEPRKGPEAVIIQKADSIGVAVGETSGMLMVTAILETADEETAVHLENVARGFTSLLVLGADIEPELAKLLAKTKTKVARDGRTVQVKLGIDAETAKEIIAEGMAKKNSQQGEVGETSPDQ